MPLSQLVTIYAAVTIDPFLSARVTAALNGHVNVVQYIVFRGGARVLLSKDKGGKAVVDIATDEPKKFLSQVKGKS